MDMINKRELGPTERAYQQLRTDLISQKFSLGNKLMINVLADQYHVSSTPVREALSRLHGEQLIAFQPGQGYFYKIPALQELQDLFRLLETLLFQALSSGASTENSASDCSLDRGDLNAFNGTNDNCHCDLDWAFDIEIMLENIVRMSNNEAAYQVTRNILARTHFVLKRAMENYNEGDWIDNSLRNLEFSLAENDFLTAQKMVQSYLHQEMEKTPDILRDVICDPYMMRTNVNHDISSAGAQHVWN